jgi:hypothetical protein
MPPVEAQTGSDAQQALGPSAAAAHGALQCLQFIRHVRAFIQIGLALGGEADATRRLLRKQTPSLRSIAARRLQTTGGVTPNCC